VKPDKSNENIDWWGENTGVVGSRAFTTFHMIELYFFQDFKQEYVPNQLRSL